MSILTKVPYINALLDAANLDRDARLDFITLLNSPSTDFQTVGFLDAHTKPSSLDNGVYGVKFVKDLATPVIEGYLVKTSTKIALLAYSTTAKPYSTLDIYEVIDSSLVKVNEYLPAEELRSLLSKSTGGTPGAITPEDLVAVLKGSDYISVDTGELEDEVLVELDQTKLETELPVEDSDDLITSGAVFNGIAEVEEQLEDKVGFNDYAEGLHVGLANNLFTNQGPTIDAAISSQSGDNYPDRANNAKGTGTYFPYGDNDWVTVENGNETIEKVYGHSYVKNNLFNPTRESGVDNGITLSNNNGVISLNGTATVGYFNFYNVLNAMGTINGHKYLIANKIIKNNDNLNLHISDINGGLGALPAVSHTSGTQLQIGTRNTYGSSFGMVNFGGAETVFNDVQIIVKVIDLTLLDQDLANISGLTADMVLKAYPDILNWEYNEGEMVDAEDFVYSSGGINLWDEISELGDISADSGQDITSTVRWRSKNYIEIIGGKETFIKLKDSSLIYQARARFYDKDKNYIGYVSGDNLQVSFNVPFLAPANAKYLRISPNISEVPQNSKIQICLHYTDTEVENTYHPYIEPSTKLISYYDGKGRSAGSVKDEVDYVAKKRIKRVIQYTFTGDETINNWYSADDPHYDGHYGGSISLVGTPLYQAFKPQILGGQGIATNGYIVAYANNDKTIYGSSNGQRMTFIDDSKTTQESWFASLIGITINLELSEPLEEDITDPTELNNSLPCNDYGIESKNRNVIAGMKVRYQLNPLRTIFNNKSELADLSVSKLSASKSAVAAVGGIVIPTPELTDDVLIGLSSTKDQLNVFMDDQIELTNGDSSTDKVAQVVGIKEQNAGNTLKFWSGTQDEYDDITTKDTNTVYYIVGE